jgi:hypothetical protein
LEKPAIVDLVATSLDFSMKYADADAACKLAFSRLLIEHLVVFPLLKYWP